APAQDRLAAGGLDLGGRPGNRPSSRDFRANGHQAALPSPPRQDRVGEGGVAAVVADALPQQARADQYLDQWRLSYSMPSTTSLMAARVNFMALTRWPPLSADANSRLASAFLSASSASAMAGWRSAAAVDRAARVAITAPPSGRADSTDRRVTGLAFICFTSKKTVSTQVKPRREPAADRNGQGSKWRPPVGAACF